MAKKNQVVNLIQTTDGKYTVKSLTNRLEPHIGKRLTAAAVTELMCDPNVKVNIIGK